MRKTFGKSCFVPELKFDANSGPKPFCCTRFRFIQEALQEALFAYSLLWRTMADRAELVAEAEKKGLGSLRLQEKYNVVRGFPAPSSSSRLSAKPALPLRVHPKAAERGEGFGENRIHKKLPYARIKIRREFDQSWGVNSRIFPYA